MDTVTESLCHYAALEAATGVDLRKGVTIVKTTTTSAPWRAPCVNPSLAERRLMAKGLEWVSRPDSWGCLWAGRDPCFEDVGLDL